MKLVRKPPSLNFFETISKKPDLFARMQASVPSNAFMRQANSRYWHWDELRRRPLPEGFTLDESWVYLKLLRQVSQRPGALTNEAGSAFTYWLPDNAQKTLSQIDRWSGDSIGADQPSLPSQERYIISSLMEEAIASSQLEGAATTPQVAKAMLRSGRRPRDHNEQMIVNNWVIMQHLRAHKNLKMSPQVLCEIHAMVTDNTMAEAADAGRIRQRDDVVVAYNKEVLHQPPPAALLPARVEAFCHFANTDENELWLHPVVKASILHFWIGYDHPFVDGNGRTARALFYWYLLSRGYWLFEYLAISRYFLRAPVQYARAYLHTETDDRDLTYFVAYNLRVVHLALADLRLYLERKQREQAVSAELLQEYSGLNLRQRNLVAYAIAHPGNAFTIEVHKNMNGIVYQTARTDLLDLVQKGLLHQEKRGKTFVFVPSENLAERLGPRRLTKG